MKWTALTLAIGLAACQHSAPEDTRYHDDIASLCDSMRLSGADKRPQEEQWAVAAVWLASATKTREAHEFFVKIKGLEGEPRARALDDEARRVGLTECALAAEWRK